MRYFNFLFRKVLVFFLFFLFFVGNSEAVSLSLVGLNNQIYNTSSYADNIIVMEIFRTTCGYCKEESIILNRLNNISYYNKHILIMGVDPFDSAQDISQWQQMNHFSFPVFTVSEQDLKGFDLSVTPAVYVLFRNSIVGHAIGFHSAQELESWFNQIIEAGKQYGATDVAR